MADAPLGPALRLGSPPEGSGRRPTRTAGMLCLGGRPRRLWDHPAYPPEVLVDWSSVTKTVTAAAVSHLAAAGVLDLDAPFRTWVPEIGNVPATVRDLAVHRSGMPTMHPGAGRGLLRDPAQGALDEEELLGHCPGLFRSLWEDHGRPRYSNLGYAFLGLVVERASGEDWWTAVRRLVLPADRLPTVTVDPAPGLHRRPGLGPLRISPWRLSSSAYRPAGGLWSTLSNLLAHAELASLPTASRLGWHRDPSGLLVHTGSGRYSSCCAVLAPATGDSGVAHSTAVPAPQLQRRLVKALLSHLH